MGFSLRQSKAEKIRCNEFILNGDEWDGIEVTDGDMRPMANAFSEVRLCLCNIIIRPAALRLFSSNYFHVMKKSTCRQCPGEKARERERGRESDGTKKGTELRGQPSSEWFHMNCVAKTLPHASHSFSHFGDRAAKIGTTYLFTSIDFN